MITEEKISKTLRASSLGKVPQLIPALLDSLSMISRAGYFHLKKIKPDSEQEPSLYAGKMESMLLTMLLDIGGVKMKDIVKDKEKSKNFFRLFNSYNQLWRAEDEVVDIKRNTTDPITVNDLLDTEVEHKRLGKNIKARDSLNIAIEAANNLFPNENDDSYKKRDRIIELLNSVGERFVWIANNPKYNQGEVLTVDECIDNKRDITGFLGEVGTEIALIALGINNPQWIKFFSEAATVMQWEDDLGDAKKDWLDHLIQLENHTITGKTVRPLENLFISVLHDFPDEWQVFFDHLHDNSEKTVLQIQKYAPKALAKSKEILEKQLDELPDHPYKKKFKRIALLMIYKALPIMPENGPIAEWAKL